MAEKAMVVAIIVGVALIIGGVGYYLGWFDEYIDLIPWFADKGDLKVLVYDGQNTTDTTDDVPIANVTVSILSTELTKKTDNNGTALYTDVEVGDYEVQADWNSSILTNNVTIGKDKVAELIFRFNTS